MALTNTSQDVRENDKDLENNIGCPRSESPKTPLRGRGGWKPAPRPLLPSEVMFLKLEGPKEIEIMKFGVPYFGRRGEREGGEGDEGGFCSDRPNSAVGAPMREERSDTSVEMTAQKEVLLAEDHIRKLGEIWDLEHSENAEESEGSKEVQVPKTPGRPSELKIKVKVEEKATRKPRAKPEKTQERKPYKTYKLPATERKPFLMKKQSKLPARLQAPTIRVRELSEGPRSPTIASKLKWVTRPPSPVTPEKKRQETTRSTQSRSKSEMSPCGRKSTPIPIPRALRRVRDRASTGSLSPAPSESSFRRPCTVQGLAHGGNGSLSRGKGLRRHISQPLIPIVPQEHILHLAELVECSSERTLEDMPLPEVIPKLEIWNNRMRKEDLCPGCRRCVVKFEFVCGDMICGGCYDRLIKESGKRGVRCIACRAVVG